MSKTRGERAITWVQEYCVHPAGPHKGEHVRLSPVQREAVLRLYDAPEQPQDVLTGPLAGFIALLHICGPEAVGDNLQPPPVEVDVFTVWNATGPDLKAVLRREGEAVVCRELRTRFPPVAA